MRLIQQLKLQLNIWAILSFLIILIILLPNLMIGLQVFSEPNENWQHIKDYLLKDYVYNTLVLILFTGIAASVIGTSLAWVISVYKFPLRNFLKWGLILPLAIPPYIGAYTYQGMLSYTGIIQSTLRNSFDIQLDQKYFDIMTMQGTVFIFTIFLFPYVYSITKSFLSNQSASFLENARLLGGSPLGIFFRVVLPISRAAIVAGASLVILEVLNDYGVVKYYGIQTLSTAIFQTWFGMGDLDSAFKLAGTLMSIVMIILVLEKILRGRKRYSYSTSKIRPIQPQPVKGVAAWLVFAYCFGIFSIAFLIPFIQLTFWMFMTFEKIISPEFTTLIMNSIFVSTTAASVIVLIALIVANYTRLQGGFIAKLFSKITVLGYSIPGAVIAIAIITLFLTIDRIIFSISASFNLTPVFVLSTSLLMLVSAYIIRFLALGYNSVEAGFEKIGNRFTEASRTLGVPITETFFKVDLPMMKGAIFSGFILVFVDILKELPLTLILQPFNFSTLATKAFQYANDEMVNEAALASMLIILISGACIFSFHKILDKEHD
ncbi:iron ABC transporter permease [Microaerobacter geothermalis]|uniref:ABC transporter permease n=1 Tax=Microaerobacter geothermalis TaxID=674972 RepID=UPI001F2EB97B|nr:iron ABC transporter permease [Microaerobacter geothermalis]MCF6094057.1 iron ABC transporter permease [Microaerobacter geothermalis]